MKIEKQTDYLFVYNKHVDVSRKVSVDLNKSSLEEVLGELFEGTNVKYILDGSYILLSPKGEQITLPSAMQQRNRVITGIVTDSNGEPVIGANVVVKGTANGTVTDVNGKYSLEIPENAIIQVSYIGYLGQNIAVKNSKEINIRLVEDTQSLEEVVVVVTVHKRKRI